MYTLITQKCIKLIRHIFFLFKTKCFLYLSKDPEKI